jgi:hypothetical protein
MSFGGEWCEDTWPNPWAPRVTRLLAGWFYVKCIGGRGVRPPDLPPQHSAFARPPDHWATGCCLFYICVLIYLKSHIVTIGGGSGRGLAPARGCLTCNITVLYIYIAYVYNNNIYIFIYHCVCTGMKLSPWILYAPHDLWLCGKERGINTTVM